MNKLCLFLEIFGHHGLSQDIHKIILDDIMTLTRYEVRCKRRLPIAVIKVINGPPHDCQFSYCSHGQLTDYVIVTRQFEHKGKEIVGKTILHHDCYEGYLEGWLYAFFK